jgi:hypothetical protein
VIVPPSVFPGKIDPPPSMNGGNQLMFLPM